MDALVQHFIYPLSHAGGYVFEGGRHSAFSDTALFNEKRFEHHHGAIQKISTRFWDAYLKGDAEAKAWLRSERPRSDGKLLEKDVWEWK